MLNPNSATSDHLSSFESGLFDRIRKSKLISLFSSLPFESPLRIPSDVYSSILSGSSTKNRDKLLKLVNAHLSWSDIGDYFSNLLDELGLDKNVAYSGQIPPELGLFSSSFEHGELMLSIPEARVEGARLLEDKEELHKDNDTFVNTSTGKLVKPNKIFQQIKPIGKPTQDDDKEYYNDNDGSLFEGGPFRDRANVGINRNAFSRLSWSDIGDYFSNLVVGLGLVRNDDTSSHSRSVSPSLPIPYKYGEIGFSIPGQVREDKQFLLKGSESGKRKAELSSDNTYHNYPNFTRSAEKIGSSRINIITDNSLNEIPGKYNADAITIGPNIIFAKDRFNAHSPRGIALLVHELTHIHQLEGIPDFYSDYNYYNIATSSTKAWEQEALEKEQFVYDQLKFSDKTNDGATGGFYGDYANIGASNGVEFDTQSPSFTSKGSPIGPSFANSNSGFYLGKAISTQISDIYPELSFANNLNSILHNITSTNASAPAGSNPMSYPVVPLLADQNRNLEASSAKKEGTGTGTGPVQASWVSKPYQSINPIPPTSTNFDIETIAERVYQILQSKIKIQRARRGIG